MVACWIQKRLKNILKRNIRKASTRRSRSTPRMKNGLMRNDKLFYSSFSQNLHNFNLPVSPFLHFLVVFLWGYYSMAGSTLLAYAELIFACKWGDTWDQPQLELWSQPMWHLSIQGLAHGLSCPLIWLDHRDYLYLMAMNVPPLFSIIFLPLENYFPLKLLLYSRIIWYEPKTDANWRDVNNY